MNNILLPIIFFLSGFSGLIYESIWTHYIKLILGHAAYAQVLVLVIFMSGLGLGSIIASKYFSGTKNLLKTYAIVEILLGLFSLFFHNIFLIANATSSLSSLLSWGAACLILLPPATLLGMTFPLFVGAVLKAKNSKINIQQDNIIPISFFYFINTIGASAGPLAASFILIPSFGLPGTVHFAGAINLLIGLITFSLSKSEKWAEATNSYKDEKEDNKSSSESTIWIYLIAAFTGLSSFLYEISWIRMLSMVFGGTTHAFEIMLSAFLIGLGIGSYLSRNFGGGNQKQYLCILGFVQVLMGIMAALTIPLYNKTFDFITFLINGVQRTSEGFVIYEYSNFLIALFVMVPATICAGMTLPLITTYLMSKGQGEKVLGWVYGWNTLGSILGVLLGVFILFPYFGIQNTIKVGAIIDGIIGIGILFYIGKNKFAPYCIFGSCLFLIIISVLKLDPIKMSSGVFRHGRSSIPEGSTLKFFEDGKTSTVSLIEYPTGNMAIVNNGKPEAAIQMYKDKELSEDETTMTLLGTLGFSFGRKIEVVANVGMGSGMTSDVVLKNPSIKKLDTIEIEEKVIKAAKNYSNVLTSVFSDPRHNLLLEDARRVFSRDTAVYDLIISEPSNPWVSGVSGLFTKEFYLSAINTLKHDGVFVQWIHEYEFSPELLSSIMRAFGTVFSDYQVFAANDGDLIIVATKNGSINKPSYKDLIDSGFKQSLSRVGLTSPASFYYHWIGPREILEPFFLSFDAPANSDFYPYLDSHASKARFLAKNTFTVSEIGMAPFPVLEFLRGELPDREGEVLTDLNYQRVQKASSGIDFISHANTTQLSFDQLLNLSSVLTSVQFEKLIISQTNNIESLNTFFQGIKNRDCTLINEETALVPQEEIAQKFVAVVTSYIACNQNDKAKNYWSKNWESVAPKLKDKSYIRLLLGILLKK